MSGNVHPGSNCNQHAQTPTVNSLGETHGLIHKFHGQKTWPVQRVEIAPFAISYATPPENGDIFRTEARQCLVLRGN